jgi:hypothetical protein
VRRYSEATQQARSSITKILLGLPAERFPRYLQIDTWHRSAWINSVVAGLWPHINQLGRAVQADPIKTCVESAHGISA